MRHSFAIQPAPDRALAARLEAAHEWSIRNYVHSLQSRRPKLGATAQPVAGGHAFYAGPSPFSFAVAVGMNGPVSASDLDNIERFYLQRRVPAKVDVTPMTDPSLEWQLRQRGYRIADLTSVLSYDLRDNDFVPSAPEVTLRWGNAADCDTWVETIARYFYVADPGTDSRKNMACMFHAPHALNVIAIVDGALAGVASMMVPYGGGIASVYGSCTVPEFRRLGVHREMLALRIETARAAGCDSVLATALPGSDSERNLERCGFHHHYVKTTWAK